ncbi:MAG: vacuolar iron transporter family protein [Solirubrobacteraceae bacterium]|nr:vacuolar iron transporter family protein [Solirubrobacteraceae bacterium]
MTEPTSDPAAGAAAAVGVRSGLGAAAIAEGERVARRSRIREVVFGAQDGLLSTLALVTGVRGAETARETILVAGLAGALAGTISMALGAYVAGKSQRDVFLAELDAEQAQLRRRPHVEVFELAEILEHEGLEWEQARRAAEAISTNERVMLKTMAEKELGIPFDPPGSPRGEGIVMGGSFFLGAAVPVLPYFFLSPATGLVVSLAVTLAVLFGIGVGKARLTGQGWLRSGLEIAGLAAGAAVLAYAVGTLLPEHLGIHAPSG